MSDSDAFFEELEKTSHIYVPGIIFIVVIGFVVPFFLTLSCAVEDDPVKLLLEQKPLKYGDIVATKSDAVLLRTVDGVILQQELEENSCGIILNDEPAVAYSDTGSLYEGRFFTEQDDYLGAIDADFITYSKPATQLQLYIYTVINEISKYATVVAFLFAALAMLYQMRINGKIDRERKQYEDHYFKRQRLDANRDIMEEWTKINVTVDNLNTAELRDMIIKADALVHKAFIVREYEGKDFGEILKKLNRRKFPPLNSLWVAHKVRNNIAHGADYTLGIDVARSTMNTFEIVLKELQVIE